MRLPDRWRVRQVKQLVSSILQHFLHCVAKAIAMLKKYALLFHCTLSILHFSFAQDPWKLTADSINPSNYYGITVANGMIGIVSSPEPFRVKEVVLAGAYDLYGRGRVSNFLR